MSLTDKINTTVNQQYKTLNLYHNFLIIERRKNYI